VTEKDEIHAPYVRSATSKLHDVVVVTPGEGLDRLPPIQGEPSPIVSRAKEEHAILRHTLTDFGVRIHPLEVHDESGYATFVADCALVVERGAILLRPSRIDRRREVPAVEQKLAAHGIPILGKIEAPGLLDGGDVVLAGDTAYVGVPTKGNRSNAIGRAALGSFLPSLGMKMVELKLAPEIPRLCNVFSALDEGLIVAANDYVDVGGLAAVFRIVEIPRGEQYGAGVLSLGPRHALANLRFRLTLPLLRKAKVHVVAIDLWEFGKVGATPSSLVLSLKRG
jgi:dimethylargininase